MWWWRSASKGIAAKWRRDTAVPVIFGVLTTDTMQQAHLERAGIKSNLGWSLWLGRPSRWAA